jgi:hypothetical protein
MAQRADKHIQARYVQPPKSSRDMGSSPNHGSRHNISRKFSRLSSNCKIFLYPYRKFPQLVRFFLKTHVNTVENSKSFPIRRFLRRTVTYPILKTFLIFIALQRFGSVAAPEGLANVPEIYTIFFCKI